MAILKIRDKDGNVQEVLVIKGEDGKDYVLTEQDKQEIAAIVSGEVCKPTLTVTKDGEKASHTSKEIYDYVQNGGNVVLQYGDTYKQLSFVNETEAVFANITDDNCFAYFSIDVNGDCWYPDIVVASPSYVDSRYDELNADIATLYNMPHLSTEDVQTMIDRAIAKLQGNVVIISFSIEDFPFQAEEGMTWREWVNSEYNTDNACVYNEGTDTIQFVEYSLNVLQSSSPVKGSDLIISGHFYYLS